MAQIVNIPQPIMNGTLPYKYSLNNKIYHVNKNTFTIDMYNVIYEELINSYYPTVGGKTLRVRCVKVGDIDPKKIIQLYTGDEGVQGWKYDKRPQTLFNSFEECLDNMKEIVDYYINRLTIEWNIDPLKIKQKSLDISSWEEVINQYTINSLKGDYYDSNNG